MKITTNHFPANFSATVMRKNFLQKIEVVCMHRGSSPATKGLRGGGFRAAKTSAGCSVATQWKNRTIDLVLPPAISRAEFSQRENFHHSGITSEMHAVGIGR